MTKCNILCIFGIITILMSSSGPKEESAATVNSGSSIMFAAKFPAGSETRANWEDAENGSCIPEIPIPYE